VSNGDSKNLEIGKHGLHFAVVELTEKCNLRCKHCYGNFVGGKSLSPEDIRLIINQLQEIGCWRITLSGGEPFILGDKLEEIFNLFRKNFKKLLMVTNGVLINDRYIEFLKKIDLLQISLDGPEKIHNYIRGEEIFSRVISNIIKLKDNGVNVALMFTANSFNIDYFPQVVEIAENLGVKLFFERYTPKRVGDELSLDVSNFFKLTKFAMSENIESSDPICNLHNHIVNNSSKFLNSKSFSGCSAGISGIAITSNLDVLPCVRIRKKIGNLKVDSLLDIWYNNPVLKQLRNLSEYKDNCGHCQHLKKCRGCRAEAIVENQELLSGDRLCFLNSSAFRSKQIL